MKEKYSLTMNSIQNICYLALMLAGVGFGKNIDEIIQSTDDKIFGGVPITSFERPYQVSIQDTGHFCGGSLISRQHVMTAAHCITKSMLQSPKEWKIMAGYELINESSPRKQYRTVESAVKHESFGEGVNKNYSNDIAIIKVSRPFHLTDTVKLAILRTKPTKVGEPCVIAGWGKTNFQSPTSNQLFKLNVRIQNHHTCQEIWQRENITIQDTAICAGSIKVGLSTCGGDSGSPLVCDNEVTGLDSLGKKPCGTTTIPSVYTEIYHYIEWIHKHAV